MNAFDWKVQPAQVTIKSPGLTGGSPNRFRNYRAKAEHDEKALEKRRAREKERIANRPPPLAVMRHSEIRRCKREILRHSELAETDPRPHWQRHHRAKVVELQEKIVRLEAIDAAKKAVLESA